MYFLSALIPAGLFVASVFIVFSSETRAEGIGLAFGIVLCLWSLSVVYLLASPFLRWREGRWLTLAGSLLALMLPLTMLIVAEKGAAFIALIFFGLSVYFLVLSGIEGRARQSTRA
jgi:peptidoglycan/LPS O-acetylase OafA/YrhL